MRTRQALVSSLGSLVLAATGLAQPLELRLEPRNRVYEDVAGELPPLVLAPVVVRLSTPRQTVLLKENRIRLERLGGGRFIARVELDVLGKGELIADVEAAGTTRRFTDELLLPRQTLQIEGIIGLTRVEGGFRVVTEQLPPDLAVAIRSRLVGQVLDLCAGAALLTLGQLDCGPVAEALENPRLPLPGPGTEFLLGESDLDAGEIAALEKLLSGG